MFFENNFKIVSCCFQKHNTKTILYLKIKNSFEVQSKNSLFMLKAENNLKKFVGFFFFFFLEFVFFNNLH